MRKNTAYLIMALIFILCCTTIVLSAEDEAPQQYTVITDNSSLKSELPKELHSMTYKNGSHLSISTSGSSIFITCCTPQAININSLKHIKVKDNSTKVLINKNNSLPKGYVPQKLIKLSSNKIKLEYSGLKLIPETANALYSMVSDAKKSNVKGFIVNSAYRSESTQREIFNSNLKIFIKTCKTYKEAYDKTRQLVALPGNSEHHTGLAVDIFSINGRHRSDFAGTKEQIWLSQNLYKYGFIIRYPKDKTKETNSTYEPWHIRYVGIPLSSYLYSKNLCLEEFYVQIFADCLLENNNYFFMQIIDNQQVYVEKSMISKAELETVKEGVQLLTFKSTSL